MSEAAASAARGEWIYDLGEAVGGKPSTGPALMFLDVTPPGWCAEWAADGALVQRVGDALRASGKIDDFVQFKPERVLVWVTFAQRNAEPDLTQQLCDLATGAL